MTNFENINRDDLRKMCKANGISYSKMNVAAMRAALQELHNEQTNEEEHVHGGYTHCPHCDVHLSNGVLGLYDEVDAGSGCVDTARSRLAETTHEFYCMGCGEQFGKCVATAVDSETFADWYNTLRANGTTKSMVATLRYIAHHYAGTRKDFISDAMALGIKETTASANWACMKRGEW